MKIFPLWLFAFCSVPFLAFGQGSLTPPPGAPGPTMKTLDQVEARTPLGQPIAPATLPITINSAGSYYLTGNVTAPSGYTGSGIVVNTNVSNVTIDLNGFMVTGVSGSNSGIILGGGVSNVAILNGTIRNWSSDGINGVGNRNVRVENIRAITNGGGGIRVDVNGVVSNCVADGNALTGIAGTTGCLITHCQTSGTSGSPGNGIQVGTGSVIIDSISTGDVIGMQMANDAQLSNCRVMNPSGVSGFAFGNGCTFDGCAVTVTGSARAFDGFHGPSNPQSANCVFRSCSESGGDIGFGAGAGATLDNCNSTGADTAFSVFRIPSDGSGTNASFSNCTATVGGFEAGSGSTFRNCAANVSGHSAFSVGNSCIFLGCSATGDGTSPGVFGFFVSDGARVSHCTATRNAQGFRYGNGCLLTDNTAVSNIQEGFYGTGTNNRIDSNLAASNTTTGFHSVTPNADQITRNTSFGNTPNYDAAGTRVGPTGGTANTTTSPWANF
jgi:hypothetical protein